MSRTMSAGSCIACGPQSNAGRRASPSRMFAQRRYVGVRPENAPKMPIIACCSPDGANVTIAMGFPATA